MRQLKKYIKIYNDSLSNVIITSEIPAQDLIKKSKLVIGINSSALIEAKVLGIDVLIPIFDELKKICKAMFILKNILEMN